MAATKLLEPLCNQPPSSPTGSNPITNPTLRSAVARIYLQGGNVQLAAHHFSLVAQDSTTDEALKKVNEAIMGAVDGDWDKSVDVWKDLIEQDSENFVVGDLFNGPFDILLSDQCVTGCEQPECGTVKSRKAQRSTFSELCLFLGKVLMTCKPGDRRDGTSAQIVTIDCRSRRTVFVQSLFVSFLCCSYEGDAADFRQLVTATLYELRSAAGLEKKKDLLIEVAKWSGDGLKIGCLKRGISRKGWADERSLMTHAAAAMMVIERQTQV